MKRWIPRSVVALAGVLLVASALAVPEASGADAKCKHVHAHAESSVLACSESPLGLCTAGEVTCNGLLKGTTFFVATALGPGADPGDTTVASDAGLWTLTTSKGTLTASTIGMLDQANQLFFDIGRITGGTGRFAGATGTVYFYGTFAGAFPALTFDVRIDAEVCLLH